MQENGYTAPVLGDAVLVTPKPKSSSKTIWLNAAMIILLALDQVLKQSDIISLLPPAAIPYVGIVGFIANYVLRYYTNSPLTNTAGERNANL